MTESIFEALLRQAVIDDVRHEAVKWEEVNKNSPPIEFSRKHKRRMKVIFAETKRLLQKNEISAVPITLRRIARRVLYAAAAALIAFNLLLLTVPAVRASAGEAIVDFFDKFAIFAQNENPNETFNASLKPKYIPEGYTEISAAATGGIVMTIYENNDDILSFAYASDSDLMQVNNESVDYSEVVYGGVSYSVFTANSSGYANMVVWDKDGLRFSVDGNIPTDELIKMAESVS
jgi:hypothetical protein